MLGEIDDAEASFADLFEQLVGAYSGANLLFDWLVERRAAVKRRALKQAAGLVVRFQQDVDSAPKCGVAAAFDIEPFGAFRRVCDSQRADEKFAFAHGGLGEGPDRPSQSMRKGN